MTTILVTGVGAIIGYGVLRSLRKAFPDATLVGTDIYPNAVGQEWADAFEVAPLTSSPNYAAWLERVLAAHNVDLLIPGIEQDVHYFSDNRGLVADKQVRLVINDARLIDLTRDKWHMYESLTALRSDTAIPSYLEGSFDELSARLGLPFLLKPRRSYASKGLLIIRERKEFDAAAAKLGDELMAQPLVGSDNGEYTVAVFGDGTGAVNAAIYLRRLLAKDGSTAKAWVESGAGLNDAVAGLCRHFKPIGPTNLQFRKDGNGWKLLEINPRISSTTSMRTAFGYNEAQMCVDYFLHGKQIVQPAIQSGFATRYIEEVVHAGAHF